MIGVELTEPALPYMQQLLKEGVVANATAVNVLRLVPALNISKTELKAFLEALERVLKMKEGEKNGK